MTRSRWIHEATAPLRSASLGRWTTTADVDRAADLLATAAHRLRLGRRAQRAHADPAQQQPTPIGHGTVAEVPSTGDFGPGVPAR